MLIKVAARDPQTVTTCGEHFGSPDEELIEAAQMLLNTALRSGTSVRNAVLAITPDATGDMRRQHKRWLMKWLHPDVNKSAWETAILADVINLYARSDGDPVLAGGDEVVAKTIKARTHRNLKKPKESLKKRIYVRRMLVPAILVLSVCIALIELYSRY